VLSREFPDSRTTYGTTAGHRAFPRTAAAWPGSVSDRSAGWRGLALSSPLPSVLAV
jgi:hypothetical protein